MDDVPATPALTGDTASRREFLRVAGLAATVPFVHPADASRTTGGRLVARGAAKPTDAGVEGEVGAGTSRPDSIYERMLGVRPVINAAGPLTSIGASVMPPEVTAAMAEASRHFVDLDALNDAAGARLAEITGAEAAMVTSGAFGGMVLAAAAALAGDDPERRAALPHVTWPRRELVIQRAHQFVYDQAYRNAGMTIVPVDTADEMRAAVGERTAMIAGLANVETWDRPGVLLPEDLVAIGRRAGVPVFIDAASEVPPASNLRRWTGMGADLVAISGGKGLRGPSSTGILAGRADLIASARAQASPHTGIGRGMKVDKEEIVGLIVAVERFLVLDHEAELVRQRALVDVLERALEDVPGLGLRRVESMGPGLVLTWNEADIPIGYAELGRRLRAGDPPIAVWTAKILAYSGEPTLYAASLRDGEAEIVGRRVREVLLTAMG